MELIDLSLPEVSQDDIMDVDVGIGVDGSQPETKKTRKPRKKSISWEHFTKLSKLRAKCNYCGDDFASDSKVIGTSSLNRHLTRCKKFPGRVEQAKAAKQQLLSFQAQGNLASWSLTKENGRRACAEYIVTAELPFKHIEDPAFIKFCASVQPKLTLVSRTTIARDIYQLYLDEKKKLRETIKQHRVSLTTDTWKSVQNINYMCVTAHFIDANWVLHKRIINFFMVPNHKGDTICREIETCLYEWGITKVMAITVDNASSNDAALNQLKKKLVDTPDFMLMDGKFLHLRCCAHIVNLIVQEGLKDIASSIEKIRSAVRYVRSSPARLKRFKECVLEARIECKAFLALDVPTRWNSTYHMLDTALKFRKAFDRMVDDANYENYFKEKEKEKYKDKEDDPEVESGPPAWLDWEKAAEYTTFLRTFYETTLKFSGTQYTTANLFFHEIFEIKQHLIELVDDQNLALALLAMGMQRKFNRYWGDIDMINELLILAAVLDPRYKLKLLKLCFSTYEDASTTDGLCARSKAMLNSLFKIYGGDSGSSQQQPTSQTSTPVSRKSQILSGLLEPDASDHGNVKTEVDYYLNDACERYIADEHFNVLGWWKYQEKKFPTLALIAKDVLAIQVSTVASESAFSGGGRIVDVFRSSLNPRMVEALVCARDWFRAHATIITEECKEEIENLDLSEIIVTEMAAVSLNDP